MEEVTLVADSGRPTGSRPANRLRREGKIPGVLYGHGIEPVPLAVGGRELRNALSTAAGANALITLDVAGTKHLAMARQVQHDPVSGRVSHVDFIVVRRDEVVAAEVPVHLVGEAKAVHDENGLVAQELFHLAIHARPGDIPTGVEVDVTALQIGEAIRVADLRLPAGVTTEVDPETPVVVGSVGRVAVLEAEAAAEAAEAEGAEAAPTEAGGVGEGDASSEG